MKHQDAMLETTDGGCYLRVETSETPGNVVLEVGHGCVRTVKEDIPVAWLTAVLTQAKDAGWLSSMGEHHTYPADIALMYKAA